MKNSISIIGGGFAGTSLVRQLVERTTPIKITLFNFDSEISKGVAYGCLQNTSLLNVETSKMSAFADHPTHFLDWCANHPTYINDSKEIIGSSFMPRKIYGDYLHSIWLETIELAKSKKCELIIINEEVLALNLIENKLTVFTANNSHTFDKCVLATGNELPGKPKNLPNSFIESTNYFKNPWNIDFDKIDPALPVLIIGNGLTMADAVLNLRENHFQQKIISISPNGFNILPHRNFNFSFESALSTIQTPISLLELIHLFNLEAKKLKKFGVSPEPIIDAFRPNIQKVWRQFSDEEKSKFMRRVRHIWGVARHRIPFISYDKIMREQINQRLVILAGSVLELSETSAGNKVKIWNKRSLQEIEILVGSVINCTGPETNVLKSSNKLLKQLRHDGLISQDKLNLGLRVNYTNFKTINSKNEENQNLFAIGSLLKGELWESTATNELKNQAKELAVILTNELLKT